MTRPLVFVSHASEDSHLRDALVGELERLGIHVWSDRKLRAGESFNERIAHALYQSRALVLISSGDSLNSDYVNTEVTPSRRSCGSGYVKSRLRGTAIPN